MIYERKILLADLFDKDEMKHLRSIFNNHKELREWLNQAPISEKLLSQGIFPDYLYYFITWAKTAEIVREEIKNRVPKKDPVQENEVKHKGYTLR